MELPDGLHADVKNLCKNFAFTRWAQNDDTVPEEKPFLVEAPDFSITDDTKLPPPAYLDQTVETRPPLGPRYLYSLDELLKISDADSRDDSKANVQEEQTEGKKVSAEAELEEKVKKWKTMATRCFGQAFAVPPGLTMLPNKATSILQEVLASTPLPCEGVTSVKGASIEPLVAMFDCEGEEHRPRRLTIQDLDSDRFNELVAALKKHPDVCLPHLTLHIIDLTTSFDLSELFQLKTASPGKDAATDQMEELWLLRNTVVELKPQGWTDEAIASCATALVTGQVRDLRWSKFAKLLDSVRVNRSQQKQQPKRSIVAPCKRARQENSRLVVFKLSDTTKCLACPLKALQRFSKFPLFLEADDDTESGDPIELPVETSAVSPHALRFVLSLLASDCFLEKEVQYLSDFENVKELFAKIDDWPYALSDRHRPLLEPLGFAGGEDPSYVELTAQQMHTILAVLRVCEFFDIPFIGNLVLLALAVYLCWED